MLLLSTIKHPKSKEAVMEQLKDMSVKNVVYIPTAANSQEGFGVWKGGGTYRTFMEFFPKMTALELEFVTESETKQLISNADIIVMAGGVPAYLSYWLHRRHVDVLIKERIKSGMLYIGVSSGAMVCSETLHVSTTFPNEVLGDTIPGLGIIDYEIWPHYKDDHEDQIKKDFEGINIRRLRDGEYLWIDGLEIE